MTEHTFDFSLVLLESIWSLLLRLQTRKRLSNGQEELDVIVRQSEVQLLNLNLNTEEMNEAPKEPHTHMLLQWCMHQYPHRKNTEYLTGMNKNSCYMYM